MKKLTSLSLAACMCFSIGSILTACEKDHTHALTKVDPISASCETAGNSVYYTCDCGKYFSDENAETEIKKDSWVLAATGHTLTKTEATSPTCTEDGNTEYYACTCGKCFSDEAGATEIKENGWTVAATGHSYTNEWTYNETHHWKAATCEHTAEKSEYTKHTLANNACACGYAATENTVTENEWVNLLLGDYLDNVTFYEETVRYKDGETEPYSTSNTVWKTTESAIYKGFYEGTAVSEEYYYVNQDDVWYSLAKKELLGIVLGWEGTAISSERAESQTFAGQIGTELAELYTSFRYDSENGCYLCETSEEGFIKVYIEEGKLTKVEMKSVLIAGSATEGTEASNTVKIYEFVTYTFSDFGTTTIDVPEWAVAAE